MYGNCYTFNSAYNNESDLDGGRRRSSMTGATFGMSLVLNIEQENYQFRDTHQVKNVSARGSISFKC